MKTLKDAPVGFGKIMPTFIRNFADNVDTALGEKPRLNWLNIDAKIREEGRKISVTLIVNVDTHSRVKHQLAEIKKFQWQDVWCQKFEVTFHCGLMRVTISFPAKELPVALRNRRMSIHAKLVELKRTRSKYCTSHAKLVRLRYVREDALKLTGDMGIATMIGTYITDAKIRSDSLRKRLPILENDIKAMKYDRYAFPALGVDRDLQKVCTDRMVALIVHLLNSGYLEGYHDAMWWRHDYV